MDMVVTAGLLGPAGRVSLPGPSNNAVFGSRLFRKPVGPGPSARLGQKPLAPRNPNTTCFDSGGGSGGGAGALRGYSGGSGGGSGRSGAAGLWAAYTTLLAKKPLLTKSVTAGVLNGLGDVLAQVTVDKHRDFDFKRLAIFAFLGVAMIGPMLHAWYGVLGRVVTSTGPKAGLMRMVLDQFVAAPFFIGSVVAAVMVLEGHGEQVGPKLRRDLFSIVRSNWALWVPFQFLNFGYIPAQFQVLAANCVALVWNVYLSYASHN